MLASVLVPVRLALPAMTISDYFDLYPTVHLKANS